jgi:formylglycine-generating enzyme required for sulfatase activity
VVESEVLWEEREPPPRIHLPAQPAASRRAWERLRDEIEDVGFRDGVRDVLHFVDEEVQLAAWWELAEITEDPDQAAIDDYLRDLAPEGMVYVPAGPFLMGSADDDPDADDREKPQHDVDLPGYYIGRYPVTNEAYAEFIAAGGYETRDYWTDAGWNWKGSRTQPGYWDNEDRNQPRQPVVGVSWYEAVAYCRWRGLRLPTEAEWEKAAGWDPQAGRKRKYPWGNEWDEGKIRSFDQGRPEVGEFTRETDNAYGVSDMAGLYTWCSTRWRDEDGNDYTYPYDASDGRENLSGGDDVWRVLRGNYGSTSEEAPYARGACRYGSDPRNWYVGVWGLRVSAPRRLLPPGSES